MALFTRKDPKHFAKNVNDVLAEINRDMFDLENNFKHVYYFLINRLKDIRASVSTHVGQWKHFESMQRSVFFQSLDKLINNTMDDLEKLERGLPNNKHLRKQKEHIAEFEKYLKSFKEFYYDKRMTQSQSFKDHFEFRFPSFRNKFTQDFQDEEEWIKEIAKDIY